ncbi:high-affinity glucose transporter HXT2 [Lipomyces kononenkoae]|uniref:High-affinity glucose transporter HXT2 n=1 Tax=Lipomyces kononenkoae TaxID=34357 RepID=A0ACC3T3X4_LIPKO
MSTTEKDSKVVESVDADVSVGMTEIVNEKLSMSKQFKSLWKSRRAVRAGVACSSAAVLIGFDAMLMGSVIANTEFLYKFGAYDEGLHVWTLPAYQQLIWTIVSSIGCMVGALAIGILSDNFGRRFAFLTTVALTMIGTVVEVVSPNWKVWTLAKVLFGVAIGFMQGNTQSYVSEITPVHIRGFMLSLFQFWIILGSFLASCVLEGTSTINSSWSWKAAIISQLGLGLMCLALFIPLVPESPYYLIGKSRHESGRAALLRLRGKEIDYIVDEDIKNIEHVLASEKRAKQDASSYMECFRGTNLRRTLLAILPLYMQQLLGFNLCGAYLAYFLSQSGIANPFVITVISLTLGMLAVIFAFVLVEHVGRRPQLLIGASAMLPCLLGMGILGFVNEGSAANNKALAALSILWNIFYYVSVGAIGWTLVGEISSSRLRAKTTSFAVFANNILGIGLGIGIPYLINADETNLGPKSGFVFLVPGAILVLIAYFVIPETKNKSFEYLDHLFEVGTPARKF